MVTDLLIRLIVHRSCISHPSARLPLVRALLVCLLESGLLVARLPLVSHGSVCSGRGNWSVRPLLVRLSSPLVRRWSVCPLRWSVADPSLVRR